MRLLWSTVAVLVFAGCPQAGETPWLDMGQDSRIRLVTSDTVGADGTMWAALDIDLGPGIKTYWRIPGETGIPITIELAGASGADVAALEWPLPRREFTGDYMDYVYYDRLVLPFALRGAETGQSLGFEVRLGLCSEVCVPASVELEHVVDLAAADPAQNLRIQQARALAPIVWEGAVADRVHVDEDTGAVRVDGLAPEIDANGVIAEIVGGSVLFDAPEAGAERLQFAPLGRGRAAAGETLRLTFATSQGAYFADIPIGAAP